jgi:hypothetical protein
VWIYFEINKPDNTIVFRFSRHHGYLPSVASYSPINRRVRRRTVSAIKTLWTMSVTTGGPYKKVITNYCINLCKVPFKTADKKLVNTFRYFTHGIRRVTFLFLRQMFTYVSYVSYLICRHQHSLVQLSSQVLRWIELRLVFVFELDSRLFFSSFILKIVQINEAIEGKNRRKKGRKIDGRPSIRRRMGVWGCWSAVDWWMFWMASYVSEWLTDLLTYYLLNQL